LSVSLCVFQSAAQQVCWQNYDIVSSNFVASCSFLERKAILKVEEGRIAKIDSLKGN
jgi:hypothetical protein